MKNIGIKDFMEYNYPTGLVTAPDGKHGAFAVVNVNEKDNCYDSCLWVMDMESGASRKVTNGKKERKIFANFFYKILQSSWVLRNCGNDYNRYDSSLDEVKKYSSF